MKKIIVSILILMTMIIAPLAQAESLFTLGAQQHYQGVPRSLFGGVQAHQIGDLLSIIMAENISLNDISKLVGVSVQYFSKLFKEEMGCNYVDWLNTLRIKRAKELINTSHLSIKEVGFKVGYNDPNYFSRIFKRYEGIAPTEYAGRREVS